MSLLSNTDLVEVRNSDDFEISKSVNELPPILTTSSSRKPICFYDGESLTPIVLSLHLPLPTFPQTIPRTRSNLRRATLCWEKIPKLSLSRNHQRNAPPTPVGGEDAQVNRKCIKLAHAIRGGLQDILERPRPAEFGHMGGEVKDPLEIP